MDTFIYLLGSVAFVSGALMLLMIVAFLIYAVFFAKQKSQMQCPYCTKVWRNETLFLEWWNDKVAVRYHLHTTPFHRERVRWFREDRKAHGFDYAIREQEARIRAGVEKPLAPRQPAYWESQYEDEEG